MENTDELMWNSNECFYLMFTGLDLVVCDIPIKFVWLAIYKWDIWIQSIWLPCASFLPIANHMNWLFIHFWLLPHHAISTSILENPRNFFLWYFLGISYRKHYDFSGFDFDLDEVWAPLNPHLKHVTKGSPSEKIEFWNWNEKKWRIRFR